MTVPLTVAPLSSWSRLMERRIVVLPQPEGPTRAVTRFSARSKVAWRTATVSPKLTETSVNLMAAVTV